MKKAVRFLLGMTILAIPFSVYAQNLKGPGQNSNDGTYVKSKGPPPKVKPKQK